jgi:hypothetical protein
MFNRRPLLFISVICVLFLSTGISVVAQNIKNGQQNRIIRTQDLPLNIFESDIFTGIPRAPELITQKYTVEKLNEEKARKDYWRFAGEWSGVVICSVDGNRIIYTQYQNEYTLQYVELTQKTSFVSEWSSYIGKSTDYLLRIFGVPTELNSSVILYADKEYYICFYYEEKRITKILLAREQ